MAALPSVVARRSPPPARARKNTLNLFFVVVVVVVARHKEGARALFLRGITACQKGSRGVLSSVVIPPQKRPLSFSLSLSLKKKTNHKT
jgi:hypothetical protein